MSENLPPQRSINSSTDVEKITTSNENTTNTVSRTSSNALGNHSENRPNKTSNDVSATTQEDDMIFSPNTIELQKKHDERIRMKRKQVYGIS